jgi:hypothetical protein
MYLFGSMANQRSKRRSRKRRGGGANVPRAVPSQRREERAERQAAARRQSAASARTLGTVGERPPSPFGGLPVSEFAVFAGLVALVVGFVTSRPTATIVGAAVCGLGVLEFSAREHFSGFRSHATLLAAVPAVLVEVAIAVIAGVPSDRILLLAPVIPVFALSFFLLRRSFQAARHARVTRPPAPKGA